MQQVTMRSAVEALRAPDERFLRKKPSNGSLSILPDLPEPATQVEIFRLILEVEAAKQLPNPLTDQQREVLMRLLAGLGVSIERLREMGQSVVRRSTYGTLAFEHWIAGEVLTKDELEAERAAMRREHTKHWQDIDFLIEQRIRQRIAKYRRALTEDEKQRDRTIAEAVAWHDAIREHELAKVAWYEGELAAAFERIAECKKRLRSLDKATRIRVWERARDAEVVPGFDDRMVEHSTFFAHLLVDALDAVEEEITTAQEAQ